MGEVYSHLSEEERRVIRIEMYFVKSVFRV